MSRSQLETRGEDPAAAPIARRIKGKRGAAGARQKEKR